MPLDVGRITHLAEQMHRSEDNAGDPIGEGYLLAADGDRGMQWVDPATVVPTSGLFYNIMDYGAANDGTTDDTAAVDATFDAADATGGGVIYIPPPTAPGNYCKLTGLLNRTGTSTYRILGGGGRYGPSRIHQATANTGVFKFAPASGTANRTKAVEINNLIISGAGGASSGKGIEVANDGHLENVFVYGFHVGMLLGTESYYSTIHKVTVSDCDSIGIHLAGTNNTTIDKCRLTGLFSTGSAPIGTLVNGIVITGGIAQRVTNTSIEYFTGYGAAIEGGDVFTFTGNYMETQQSTTGFAHLWLGNSTATNNSWVVGNYFQGDGISGFNAIKLDNAVIFHIIGNEFGKNQAIGIAHTGGSSAGYCWGNTNNPAGTFILPSDTVTTPGGFANPMTTAGDLIKGGASGAPGRLAIGTNGDILTVVSGVPAWQANSVVADLDDLTDVVITSPASNNDLRYDGTNWVNTAGAWRPVMDGAGAVITDGATGEAIVAFS